MSKTSNLSKRITIILFYLVEFLLYGAFLFLDVGQEHLDSQSSFLKILSIFICFVTSMIITWPLYKNELSSLLVGATFLTLLADFFLLFTSQYALGVFLFALVQLCYHLHLYGFKRLPLFLLIPSLGTVILLITLSRIPIVAPFLHKNIAVITVASYYFLCLLMNTISVLFCTTLRFSLRLILFTGFILLLICDLQVGYKLCYEISGLSFGTLGQALYRYTSTGMWLFYLPSQVLLITYLNGYIKGNHIIR